ncbi:MAG: hypothetical protein ACRDHW_10310 [Ktedonobacteraceae bacterium]
MLKLMQHIRWLVPLVLVAIIAAYFVFSPMIGAHAAGPVPNALWPGH